MDFAASLATPVQPEPARIQPIQAWPMTEVARISQQASSIPASMTLEKPSRSGLCRRDPGRMVGETLFWPETVSHGYSNLGNDRPGSGCETGARLDVIWP
jgi:hypothetical protein